MLCINCFQQMSGSSGLCYVAVMPLVMSHSQKVCNAAFFFQRSWEPLSKGRFLVPSRLFHNFDCPVASGNFCLEIYSKLQFVYNECLISFDNQSLATSFSNTYVSVWVKTIPFAFIYCLIGLFYTQKRGFCLCPCLVTNSLFF